MNQNEDTLTIDVSYDCFSTGHTDVQISSTLKKSNAKDLMEIYGSDIEKRLTDMLSEELAKTIDKEVIKGIQKAIFDATKEEMKINAKRRIILNRLFSPPPEYFKNY
jgi:hypothetical protein